MGGSVLVRACPMLQENKYRITGVAVLDVVEGMQTESDMHHAISHSRENCRVGHGSFTAHAQTSGQQTGRVRKYRRGY